LSEAMLAMNGSPISDKQLEMKIFLNRLPAIEL
jgi:hypothetical protein